MPRASHTLYCDETGNTGSRFLDLAQPMYAEGGWFIANSNKQKAADAVLRIEQKFNFGATELKGADLVKRTRGQAMLREVTEAVGKHGGIPYAYVVEKRYAVCSKIVETFFDPEYNPTVPNADTWNPQKRQEDAQFFYEHDGGQLIEQFAEAYRLKDPSAVYSNASNWVVLLRAKGFHEQAERVEGVLSEIEDEMRNEAKHDASNQMPRGMNTLNLPIVAEVFQFVEQHCPYPCDIVHDQIIEFEPVYRWVFDKMQKAKPGAIEMDDGRQLRTGFVNALSLSFADSKTEPMIRAADYSLAGTRKFVQLALAGEQIPADLTRVAFGTLGALLVAAYTHIYPSLGSMPELTRCMSSTWWCKTVFGRLELELKSSGANK